METFAASGRRPLVQYEVLPPLGDSPTSTTKEPSHLPAVEANKPAMNTYEYGPEAEGDKDAREIPLIVFDGERASGRASNDPMRQASKSQSKCRCCFCCVRCCPKSTDTNKPADNIIRWTTGELDERRSDEDDYLVYLAHKNNDIILLADELFEACRANHIRRTAIICRYLREQLMEPLESRRLQDADGYSPLLAALSCNSSDVAKLLIQLGGKNLILKQIQNRACEGVTALHLAISHGIRDVIRMMLDALNPEERHFLLHCQASGPFFSGRLRVNRRFIRMNGLPLVMSLWSGNKDIFGDLLEYGAVLDATDTNTGNSLLHSLVEYGLHDSNASKDMLQRILDGEESKRWYCKTLNISLHRFSHPERYHLKTHLLKLENNDGYTPLTLAAKLGVYEVMALILNCEGTYRFPKFHIGPCSYSSYDMQEVDPTVAALVRPGKPTVLELLAHTNRDEDLAGLLVHPVKQLLEQKWLRARPFYYCYAIFHIVLMIVLSIFALWRTALVDIVDAKWSTISRCYQPDVTAFHTVDIIRYQCVRDSLPSNVVKDLRLTLAIIICITILSVPYLVIEVIDVMAMFWFAFKSRVLGAYLDYYTAPWRVLFKPDVFRLIILGFSVAITLHTVVEMMGLDFGGELLAIALVFGWYYVLYFLQTIKMIGFFTVMLHRILFRVLLRFAFIFVILLIAFSLALAVISHVSGGDDEYSIFSKGMLSLVRLMLISEDLQVIQQARNPRLATAIFIIFLALTVALLLNMLVAVMRDMYIAISGMHDDLWRKLRIASVLLMERRASSCCRQKCLSRYLQYDKRRKTWLLQVEEISHRFDWKREPNYNIDDQAYYTM